MSNRLICLGMMLWIGVFSLACGRAGSYKSPSFETGVSSANVQTRTQAITDDCRKPTKDEEKLEWDEHKELAASFSLKNSSIAKVVSENGTRIIFDWEIKGKHWDLDCLILNLNSESLQRVLVEKLEAKEGNRYRVNLPRDQFPLQFRIRLQYKTGDMWKWNYSVHRRGYAKVKCYVHRTKKWYEGMVVHEWGITENRIIKTAN